MGTVVDRFEIRFRKVVDYWTIDAFPPPHRDRVMFRTNDLSQGEIEELNNQLLDHCEKAPSIVKIVGFAAGIRAKRKVFKTDYSAVSIPCQECDGDGYLSAYKMFEGRQYFYSFKCPSDICIAAQQNVPSGVQKWTEEFRKEYTPKWEYAKKLTAVDVVAAAKRLKTMGFNVPKKYLGVAHGQETTRGREDQTQTTVRTDGRREGAQVGIGSEVEQEACSSDRGEENRSGETLGRDQRPPDQNI